MKYVTPLLISFSLLAFAAQAADDAKKNQAGAKPSMSQTGDAKASGSASAGASGAKAKSSAKMDFDKLDTNKDGQLSRTEFEAMHKSGASAGKTSSPAKSSTGASGGASTSGSAGTAGSATTGKTAK